MAMFYAQPYDIHASGFYFEDAETYRSKITSITNDYGDPVEEFEIQFIDGEDLDCELSKALCSHQGNVVAVMKAMEDWEEHQKLAVIIVAGECGYSFDPAKDEPDSLDVTIYHVDSLKELAEQFAEEGLFGEVPENLRFYIDYDAMARDLGADYVETTIAGERLVYRCA
jgi:antirestriction protein